MEAKDDMGAFVNAPCPDTQTSPNRRILSALPWAVTKSLGPTVGNLLVNNHAWGRALSVARAFPAYDSAVGFDAAET